MARGKSKRPAAKATEGESEIEKVEQIRKADRALLLAHTERLQDFDHAGGVRAALCHEAGEHLQGRAVQSGLPEDLTQQPHAGDHRSAGAGRATDLDLRVRCDPAISRAQDREVLSGGRARARRSRSMAVLANGRRRADGRSGAPFQELRRGNIDLCDQSLRQRGEPALRRDEHPPQGSSIHRRQIFHRRHGAASAGSMVGNGRDRT